MVEHPFLPSKTLVIYNPTSGRPQRQKKAKEISRRLKRLGFQVTQTQEPGDARGLGQRASKEGWKAVICLGGDGTLFEAIAELPHSISIAFFPTGTVNLFSKNLAIPHQVEPWLTLLESGSTQQVYFGLGNGRPFASVGSVGFDAQVVARVSSKFKRWIHEGAYVLQGGIELLRYRIPKLKIVLDGVDFPGHALGILVGKGPHFAGPYPVLEGAALCAPTLCVAVLHGDRKAQLLRFFLGVALGNLARMEGVSFYHVKEVQVSSEPETCIELDGDPVGNTPVTFSVEGKIRKVLAPAKKE